MRVRTWHFYLTGALGGLIGFILMEVVRAPMAGVTGKGQILALACQFAAFGLAVGAALGATEGALQGRWSRAIYGLVIGVVLGAAGGFVGGGAGQAIFSLLPAPPVPDQPGKDVAIVLDASGSMEEGSGFLFWSEEPNDPKRLRLKAARRLVERLGTKDRVAIVDFATGAQVLHPLTLLDGPASRKAVLGAIDLAAGNKGGTNLSAGLAVGLDQLVRFAEQGRAQHLIFLTDGDGEFSARVLEPALARGIPIYSVGLGPGVNRPLLEETIARPTKGRYFPVAKADELLATFDSIFDQALNGDMAKAVVADHNTGMRKALRILAWAVMGLMIGLGQGVRENTQEDLIACGLGGLIGGLLGGAIFEPVSTLMGPAGGMGGRAVADITVAAFIGGSMRLAQAFLVERRASPTTTLLDILPASAKNLVVSATVAGSPSSLTSGAETGLKGLALRMKHSVENAELSGLRAAAMPPPVPPPTAATSRRRPLSYYESRYSSDRARAMAAAFASGHYTASEIATHFGVPESRVARAISETEIDTESGR